MAINVIVLRLSAVFTEESCFVISRSRFLFVIPPSFVYPSSAGSLLDLIRATFLRAVGGGVLPVNVGNACFALWVRVGRDLPDGLVKEKSHTKMSCS